MKSSLIAIAFFIAGVACARFNLVPDILLDSRFTLYALYLQMFIIGVCMGGELNKSLILIKQLNIKILLVPLATIIGTIAGALLISFFIKSLCTKDILAVGSGFGYYSLSSIYISELRNETLGVIALLANICREIFGLLFVPIIAKYFGKIAPISAAGATSMDTCLPIITTSIGKNYAILSVFHGTIITILVPFIITFILN